MHWRINASVHRSWTRVQRCVSARVRAYTGAKGCMRSNLRVRLLPPHGCHHHPADLYISQRVSHFRHYHSCRGCASPCERANVSLLFGFSHLGVSSSLDYARTPVYSLFIPRISYQDRDRSDKIETSFFGVTFKRIETFAVSTFHSERNWKTSSFISFRCFSSLNDLWR